MLGSKLDNSDYDSSTTRTRFLSSSEQPRRRMSHPKPCAQTDGLLAKARKMVSYDPFTSTSAQASPHTNLHRAAPRRCLRNGRVGSGFYRPA